MSVLRIRGVDFAVGLRWLSGRPGLHLTIWDSRRSGRPFYVRREGQTGYALPEAEHENVPSLAGALADVLRGDHWVAAVEADDGRYAVIAASWGELIADEDRVIESREAALGAVETARKDGFAVHAPEGLVPDAEPLDWQELLTAAADAARLRPAPLSRLGRQHLHYAAAASVAVAAGMSLWSSRDALLEMVYGPPKQEEIKVIPRVEAAVDTLAFIEGCRQALRASPAGMPAWKTESVTCYAEMQDPQILGAAPQLNGRPVLFARWVLHGETSAPAAHRRLAEARLASWYAGGTSGDSAWGVRELPVVLRPWRGRSRPNARALRRDVDGAFGLVASIRQEKRRSGEGQNYVIASAQTLDQIAALAAVVPGLEVRRLSLLEDGGWRLEARPVTPRFFREPVLEALTTMLQPVGGTASGGA